MKNDFKFFESKNVFGEKPLATIFDERINEYYAKLAEAQLKDGELWSLLERQFKFRYDVSDGGWRGEFWGKLMRGGCMVYSYLKDEELYSMLERSAMAIISLADEEGRISSYPEENEFFGWDMWGRKYVMLGLSYFYDIAKSERVKERIITALTRQADYIVKKIGDGAGQKPITATSAAWGAINSVSVLQPFVKLFKLTGKSEYEDFIKTLIKTRILNGFNLFEAAKENKKTPSEYPVTKAYEIISCFEGLLDYYEITGEKEYLGICVNFADAVLKTDFTVIGGIGCYDEYFNGSTAKQVEKSEIHKQETCVTVTLMKYLANLFRLTGDTKYVDAAETSFFNAYLGAYNVTSVTGHIAVPCFYSYSPIFDEPRPTLMGGCKSLSNYAVCGCCVAIGAAGLGVLPALSATGGENGVTLNMFLTGGYSGAGTDFNIVSDYPDGGNVKITFGKVKESVNKVRIRIPSWSAVPEIFVNGVKKDFYTENGYAVLTEIKTGDCVNVAFSDEIKVISSQSVNEKVSDLYALKKCATVLSADSAETDLKCYYDLADENNCAYIKEGEKYIVETENGKVPFTAYRNAGKDFYRPRDISVWIKKQKIYQGENI